MPLYNRRGDLVFGADQYAALWRRGDVPRKLADDTTRPAHLNDDVQVWQGGARKGSPHIAASDGRTWSVAGEVVAGGHRWAAFYAGNPWRVYDSLDLEKPIMRACHPSIGYDGTLIYCRDREGKGIAIREPGHKERVFEDERVLSTLCLSAHACAWFYDLGKLRVWNGASLRDYVTAHKVWFGRLFLRQNQLWIVYQHPHKGVVLHAVGDPTKGYHLAPTSDTFNPDAVEVNGQLRVCYSTVAGERASSLDRSGDVIKDVAITAAPEPFHQPTPPAPDPEDDMSQEQLNAINKRLSKIEQRIADQQDEITFVKAELLRLVPTPQPQPEPEPTPEPEPPSNDAPTINLKDVVWLHTDVSDWPETSHIERVGIEWPKNGDTDNGTVCFPHTKAGKWPTFDNGQGEGNVWVFGKIGGTWYAATCEWLKPGQTCKRFSNRTESNSWGIGPHTKKSPLKSWGPKSGEWIGIMVSGRARDGERSVEERSNVCWVKWP